MLNSSTIYKRLNENIWDNPQDKDEMSLLIDLAIWASSNNSDSFINLNATKEQNPKWDDTIFPSKLLFRELRKKGG